MKELAATATGETGAPRERAFALLVDVERYPEWYPAHVRMAEVLERTDRGEPIRVKTALRGSIGPIGGEFRIHMSVEAEPHERVALRRLPKSGDDREEMSVVWRLSERAGADGGTLIEVELAARLSIPRLTPVGTVPQSFARGFVEAAVAALGG